MMRLCAMGDSHIAAMKMGWDLIEADHPDVSIQFYAAPGQFLKSLYVDNGKLVSPGGKTSAMMRMTSGGEPEIDPDRFDGFFLCGLRFRLAYIIRELVRQCLELKVDTQSAEWRASFEATATEIMKNTLSYRTALLIRRVTSKPVAIVAHPMPIVPEKYSVRAFGGAFGRTLAAIGGVDQFMLLVKNAARAIPSDVATVLWQPPETLVGGYYSKAEYLSDIDRYHMNGAFGAVTIPPIVEHLTKASRSQMTAPSAAPVLA